MHRDTQIGLAMAIVLIGFAAALCFPRESRVQLAALQLSDAPELDARIDELPVRVYTQLEAPSVPARVGAPSAPVTTPPPPPVAAAVHAIAAAAPAPIAGERQQTVVVTIGPLGASAEPAPASDIPEVSPMIHVVQSGDTLSGIALQYLGSVARYPEIFEANRNQLNSPDDLRLGQRLLIPRRK